MLCRGLPRTGGSIVFSLNIVPFMVRCIYKHGRRGSDLVFLGFQFGTQTGVLKRDSDSD